MPFFFLTFPSPALLSPLDLQARLETYKAAKEAQSAEALKAELDAKMAKAAAKHEELLKTKVERYVHPFLLPAALPLAQPSPPCAPLSPRPLFLAAPSPRLQRPLPLGRRPLLRAPAAPRLAPRPQPRRMPQRAAPRAPSRRPALAAPPPPTHTLTRLLVCCGESPPFRLGACAFASCVQSKKE